MKGVYVAVSIAFICMSSLAGGSFWFGYRLLHESHGWWAACFFLFGMVIGFCTLFLQANSGDGPKPEAELKVEPEPRVRVKASGDRQKAKVYGKCRRCGCEFESFRGDCLTGIVGDPVTFCPMEYCKEKTLMHDEPPETDGLST